MRSGFSIGVRNFGGIVRQRLAPRQRTPAATLHLRRTAPPRTSRALRAPRFRGSPPRIPYAPEIAPGHALRVLNRCSVVRQPRPARRGQPPASRAQRHAPPVDVRSAEAAPLPIKVKDVAPLRYAPRRRAQFMAGSLFGPSYKSVLCNQVREKDSFLHKGFYTTGFSGMPPAKKQGRRGHARKIPSPMAGHFFKGTARFIFKPLRSAWA